jgi:hypothetical protein
MAKQTRNVVTYGLSGKVGELLVFRQVKGKTVVSSAPQQSKKVSEKQQSHRGRFRQAVIYAKAATTGQSGSKALYDALAAKKGQTPFIVAVADFFNAPEIRQIDLSRYTGQVGDEIRIEVSDDAAVKEIGVSITNADGSPVEEGFAQSDASGSIWTYKATQTNANLSGDKIVVSVYDFPENTVRDEQVL